MKKLTIKDVFAPSATFVALMSAIVITYLVLAVWLTNVTFGDAVKGFVILLNICYFFRTLYYLIKYSIQGYEGWRVKDDGSN